MVRLGINEIDRKPANIVADFFLWMLGALCFGVLLFLYALFCLGISSTTWIDILALLKKIVRG